MKKNPRARLAAILALSAGTALGAGQTTAPSTDAPTFKVQVDYVEVDTLVVDRQGNLVRDLKKEDFQVFEDGKPQTISAFSLVDIPVERYERPLYARQPIDPDVSTNERPFDGRMYVAVIDDLHTYVGHTAQVRSAARQFIERRLGANDLMAVMHVGAPDSASQDFTNSKRLLLAAVDKTLGRQLESSTVSRTNQYFRETAMDIRQAGAPVTDPLEGERADNARRSLDTLRDVARWFADVHGRRKSILFFSEGIDYDITDVFNHPNASLMLDITRETIAAASRGNVSIYALDPRGMTGQLDEAIEAGSFPDDTSLGIGQQSMQKDLLLSQSSLRELGEETGGFAAVNTNDFSRAFDRIVRDNSTYYVLAYYPPGGSKPGKVHSIDVRVRRPDVTVRARKAYVTPKAVAAVSEKDAKNSKNPPSSASKMMTPEIHAALDSPIPISGLTLHVFAAPFKGEAPNAAVVLGVDLRGRDLRLNTGDKITVSYVAADTQGKIRGGSTEALTINLRPETKTRATETGFRLVNRMDLPPGRYQIRVAAHDGGGGSLGSVLYNLEVPDFSKGPLAMSGIALASALGAAMPIAHIDEQFKTMLPAVPGASRTFPRNDELLLFAEVYDNEPTKPHKVDITSTITTDDGKELFKTDEVRESTDLQGKRGGYGYAARIPLRDLAPGSYVLTVSARSRLGEGSPVERQLQFKIGER